MNVNENIPWLEEQLLKLGLSYNNREIETSSKCGGACCRSFWLPTQEMLQKHLENNQNIVETKIKENRVDESDQHYVSDVERVIEIVIPIDDYISPDQKRKYTCKVFNTETNLCSGYDKRPDMCKKFPLTEPGGVCKFESCTSEQRMKDTSKEV